MKCLHPAQYPTLTKYANDLTLQIAEGEPAPSISEADQVYVYRIFRVLNRRRKNDLILIGEDEMRMLNIIHEVARRIVNGELPDGLTTSIQRIFVFRHDLFFGDEENTDILRDRMTAMVNELKASDGQIALFINHIHQVVGMFNERTQYVGRPFAVAHARGEIRFIGATTIQHYREYLDTAALHPFARRSPAIDIT